MALSGRVGVWRSGGRPNISVAEAALEDVPFIPLGEYWQATAYRKDLTDVLPGCFAVFYSVRRA